MINKVTGALNSFEKQIKEVIVFFLLIHIGLYFPETIELKAEYIVKEKNCDLLFYFQILKYV